MVEPSNFYVGLATREGFNASVRHINKTLELLDTCNPKKNIADEINRLLNEKILVAEEVQAAVNMLLVEKAGYTATSRNIGSVATEASLIVQETAKWKAVDLVIGYHHPDLGFIVINPKNPESAEVISGFRKNELVVLYAGSQDSSAVSHKNAELALAGLFDLLEDRKIKAPASLLSGPYDFMLPQKAPRAKVAPAGQGKAKAVRTVKSSARAIVSPRSVSTTYSSPDDVKPAANVVSAAPVIPAVQAASAIPGQSKMTPLISVVVSNELFHNGNVEAWKRIIRSYNSKYPNLQVSIYYDGERIIDINTLFKWGKVKHGSCIQFRVAGENIQDLAKLSRYFKQGASSQYEAFLHGSPDTVMNLF